MLSNMGCYDLNILIQACKSSKVVHDPLNKLNLWVMRTCTILCECLRHTIKCQCFFNNVWMNL